MQFQTLLRPRSVASLLAGLVLLSMAAGAVAQWRLVIPDENTDSDSGSKASAKAYAFVESEGGERLTIIRQGEDKVVAQFELPGGALLSPAPGSCPTYVVDELPPMVLGSQRDGGHGPCNTNTNAVEIPLGAIADNTLDSPTIVHLMNGSELRVRYRLIQGGYREARFTLRRSKQALTQSLGSSIRILEPDPPPGEAAKKAPEPSEVPANSVASDTRQ